MCVQFCFGSATVAAREAPGRELHAFERAERDQPRRGTSSTANGARDLDDGLHERAVVLEANREVVEVVFEPALDDAWRR